MIRRHDFNSEWWGGEVGIVHEAAFFDLASDAQRRELEKFAWVEFVQPASEMPDRWKLTRSGFFYTDSQVRFRLDLRRVQASACAAGLVTERATEKPFSISNGELAPFEHERFYALAGASEEKITERYVLWSNKLIAQHSETCLRFLRDGQVQGWFLSHPAGGGLELTLAMLSAGSRTSGADLYGAAAAAYRDVGFKLGFASFSITNTAVHNIYASMGARFLEPKECWMWERQKAKG